MGDQQGRHCCRGASRERRERRDRGSVRSLGRRACQGEVGGLEARGGFREFKGGGAVCTQPEDQQSVESWDGSDDDDEQWEIVEIGVGRAVIPPLRFSVLVWPEWLRCGNKQAESGNVNRAHV